ncbi:MAG TPA: sulfurtransferase [Caldilineaceae bacterium]|nr:sulfurtransferase [Caldilineaceae bacterium]
MYTTLIATADLAAHLADPNWVLVDCRFKLDDKAAGRKGYLAGPIPGAVYAHLDQDLSGPIIPGQTGRHPLPSVDSLVQTLSRWGIDGQTQVVAYDDNQGMMAGRLWWMLRWLGHDAVAVLDGGFRSWQQESRPVVGGEESRTLRRFVPHPRPEMQVSVDEVMHNLHNPQIRLFDARDEARYRGEVTGLDPVAGHIPGAQSAFYGHNLDADGKFLPPEQLRARYAALLGDTPPEETVFYCGSGVSVHHDLIALEHAGLGRGARVYIGSWSEWITDPSRPIATGDQP